MTTQESRSLNKLSEVLTEIKQENKLFKESITEIVQKMNSKVEHKHLPVSLEANILQKAQESIGEAIKTNLTGYNSPLQALVNNVIVSYNDELKDLINLAFKEVITHSDFKNSILQGFTHKIAKSIVQGGDGMIDKTVNELKNNPEFKAKLILLVSGCVNDYLTNK